MRRIDLRREDGVAMTEFALIVPVFLLIVAGLLGFGRVFFYWIETNHMASETARWAVVDRNPYDPGQTLQQHVRDRRAPSSSQETSRSASTSPARTRRDGRSRRSRAREDPEAVRLRADPRHRADHDTRARRRCGSSGSQTAIDPTTLHGRRTEHRNLLMNRARPRRARRHPRDGRGHDSGVPRAHGARRRRRQLVHAQAPAPEPRRRGCVRGRRRVREELEGVRPGRRPVAEGVDGEGDRGRSAPVRRRPRSGRLRGRRAAVAAPQHRDREPGRTSTSSSTRRRGLQRRHRLHPTPAVATAGNPCYSIHAGPTTISPAAATGSTSG